MKRWMLCWLMYPVLIWADAVQACPLCKDAIPNSDAQSAASLPGGFNYSIYYMLGSLFCVLGGFGFFIFRTIRNTDRVTRAGGLPTNPSTRG